MRSHTAGLMVGRLMSQVLLFAATPLLTRLYPPAAFGQLMLFTSVLGVLTIAASLRFEQAIVIVEGEDHALGLVKLSAIVVLSLAVSAQVILTILIRGGAFDPAMVETASWVPYLPLGLLIAGWFQILNLWLTRSLNYRNIAISLVIQALTTIFIQATIVKHPAHDPLVSLIGGQIAGQGIALAYLLLSPSVRRSWEPIRRIPWPDIADLIKRYRRFPLIDIWAQLINAGAQNAPSIIIGAIFGSSALGVYALGARIVNAPIQLVFSSVSQVFYQKYNATARSGNARQRVITRTMAKVSLFSGPAFVLLLFTSPSLFAALFGPQWSQTGVLIQALTPMLFLRSVLGFSSSVLWSEDRQGLHLAWQILFLLGTLVALVVGALGFQSLFHALAGYSAAASILYLLLAYLVLRVSREPSAFLSKGKWIHPPSGASQ